MIEPPSTLINGEPAEAIAVTDRGLAYGQGVFETIRISHSVPLLWAPHLSRLKQSCVRLGVSLADNFDELLSQDVSRLSHSKSSGVIKIIVTAGSGGRGYAAPQALAPRRIVTFFPLPDYPLKNTRQGIRVITCQYRLPLNPRLAGMKHLNRLDQVLARSEWSSPDIAEGIVLDTNDRVVEGTMSNLFAYRDGVLITPSLAAAGVRGVMRDYLLELACELGIQTCEVSLAVEDFKRAEEVFVTNSVLGLWPVTRWDESRFKKGPVATQLLTHIDRLFKCGEP